MSIIEKALDVINENKQEKKNNLADTSNIKTSDNNSNVDVKNKEPNYGKKDTSKKINIDINALEKKGYLTPNCKNKMLFEQYRRIKMPILENAFENCTPTNNIIMITSCLSGEGKSYTSVNLAMSIAYEYNHTVLFIDADIIRKTVSRMFSLENNTGLIEYLKNDSAQLADSIFSTNIAKLNILPAGIDEDDLITELFTSHKMELLVAELSTRYNDRIIIIDSPPFLLDSSSRALLNYAKQTLLVVEAEKTPKYIINDAINQLSEINNVGVVLNKSNQNLTTNYGYYYK